MEKGNAVLALLGAHVLCCGLIVLGLGGALGALFDWLVGDGLWAAIAAAFVASTLIVWHRRRRRAPSDDRLATFF